MKTAVLLFGHVRTFAKTKQSYLQLFQELNADIFIHTWDVYGFSTNGDSSRCYTPGLYSENYNIEPRWDSGVIDFGLFSDLNIKACVIENKEETMPKIYEQSLKYKDYRAHEADHPGNIISCNRKIYLVNQLFDKYCKNQNITYDKVILLRFDLTFNRDIFINADTTNINVYSGPYGYAAHMSACGTPSQISKYADIYNQFDYLVNNGTKFNPHMLDEAYLRMFNISHVTYSQLLPVR